MFRLKVHGYFASSCFISFYNLVNNLFALFFSLFKFERFQLCIGLLCYIIQTDLFDHQFITDRLNAWKSTVKLRKNSVNAACGKNSFTGVVVSCMAVKYFCIMSASELKVLSHAGAAYQLKALCACCLSFCNSFFGGKSFLKVYENRMLMSCDHNIDIIRVNHTKTYRCHAKFRFS